MENESHRRCSIVSEFAEAYFNLKCQVNNYKYICTYVLIGIVFLIIFSSADTLQLRLEVFLPIKETHDFLVIGAK